MTTVLQYLAQFVLIYFLQSILYVIGIVMLSKTPFQWKPILICSVLSMIATFILRTMLTFGIHTLFSLIILIMLAVLVLKIPAQKVVKIALLIAIVVFIIEGMNFVALRLIFGEVRFEEILNDKFTKSMAGVPTNILLGISLGITYLVMKKREAKKGE